MLEKSSTEKVTGSCLHFTTSLILYKQKLSMEVTWKFTIIWCSTFDHDLSKIDYSDHTESG